MGITRNVVNLLMGRSAGTAEDREAAYYLRVTLIVALALIVGAIGQQTGVEGGFSSTVALVAFAVAYLVGGYRIALDSWEELKKKRLSIDFLMGAAAVGAAVVGSELEGVVLIFLFSLSK